MGFIMWKLFLSFMGGLSTEGSSMRLVKILWDDAYSLPDDWHELPLAPPETRPMTTVGFIVSESKWGLSVAHTHDPEGETCAGVIVIPKGMIRKITDLVA